MNPFIKKLAIVYICTISALVIGVLVDNDPAMHGINGFISEQKIDKSKAMWKHSLPKPPQVKFSQNRQYIWEMVTNKGPITIALFPDHAPMHVSSTLYLTTLGFYDGLTFHRVIPGFMAQGGDPQGNGRGDPGYRYDGEFAPEASHSKLGMVSMANSGPNSDGSQFFITFKATRFLDGRHTVFGEVIAGRDTLKAMESIGTQSGKTQDDIVILKANIVVKKKPS